MGAYVSRLHWKSTVCSCKRPAGDKRNSQSVFQDIGKKLQTLIGGEKRRALVARGVAFRNAQSIAMDNRGKQMDQGEVLATNISGNLPPYWGENVQVSLGAGTKNGTENFSLQNNVIQVRGAFVFAGSN